MFNFTGVERVKIDVGLAGDAPNSAMWLADGYDVIGIEPLEYHWQHLTELGSPDNNTEIQHPNWMILQLGQNAVTLNREKICDASRFIPVKAAIDNCDPCKGSFFVNGLGETGSSSLIKGPKFDHEVIVDIFSLEYLCNNLPWDKLDYICQVKTDCEGKDFDVIRSLGNYLTKTIYITCETCHYNNNDTSRFISELSALGFAVINRTPDSIELKNTKFDITFNNRTLGQ